MCIVKWTESAVNELWNLTIHSSREESPLLKWAVEEIDWILRTDPYTAGESREDNRRVLLVPPIGVKYSVDSSSPSVLVIALWKFGSRQKPN